MKRFLMILFAAVVAMGMGFSIDLNIPDRKSDVIYATPSLNYTPSIEDVSNNSNVNNFQTVETKQKDKPIVVVAPFTKVGEVSANDAEAVTELFTSMLVGHGKLTIVEHGNLDAVLRELKFQTTDWANDMGKVDSVGKAINAQYVVRGQLMHLGSDYFCSVSVIQLENLEIISSSRGQFKKLEDILNVLPNIVNETTRKMLHEYAIGEIGPGGGIVFYIEGNRAWECSELLGQASWENAKTLCRNYRGGGYSDWYLPTKDELNNIYQNLRRTGKIAGNDWYWSSSPDNHNRAWGQRFSDGYQYYDPSGYSGSNTSCVRAVRAFSN